jgi:hypothetical protein
VLDLPFDRPGRFWRGNLHTHSDRSDRCSPASRILVTGCVPGKQVRAGDALTGCTLPLDMFQASPYIRVTVIDASGARAWSNPIRPG